MSMQTGHVIGNRYQIQETLGSGAMGTIYRAFDRFGREPVALKKVKTDTHSGIFNSGHGIDTTAAEIRMALAHEFQTLASLHHPNVIGVKDYGFDADGQPYFTMHLVENAEILTRAAQNKSLAGKVTLLTGMLQAMVYVHRRGIVHRDLKPENVLVTVDGTVKVVDFGLALIKEARSQAEEQTAGTLAYMAPEMIMGEAASPESDLYAVGMMAYQMIGGHYPFDTMDIGQLIHHIISTPLDLGRLDIEYDLIYVLDRLLKKSPEDRYHDAYEVIVDISHAIDQPVPHETVEIRESFLQAAKFIGRDEEIGQLSQALTRSIEGKGSAWLLGGESGVGKSRLLAELKTRALVRGVLVLHGQGVAEGGLPYQLWREPLRRLILATDADDQQASILKQILPDIETVLERPIPDAPELGGQAGQQRLMNAITSVFRRQQQPLVLFLEDLHWAIESLDILKALYPQVEALPVLIVGSYRDDEKPTLPEGLPGMNQMKLGRLSDRGIAQLSAAMLGDIGSQPEILELLQRETEGNVFFLVEVVRALADEAGKLTDIGTIDLPQQVAAGGIQDILNRRLENVSAETRTVLKLASIIGRQIDNGVLQHLVPELEMDEWLTTCANAAILDVFDGQWRFAHDKLREAVSNELSEQDTRQAHNRVAAAYEATYSDSLDEYAATIGGHYEQANEPMDATTWYIRAGTYAEAKIYAPTAAISFYEKALEFLAEIQQPEQSHLKLKIDAQLGMGNMLTYEARYDEAIKSFKMMHSVAETIKDEYAQARAWYGISLAHLYQGDLKESIISAERGEKLARVQNDKLFVAKYILLQGWNALRLGELQKALDLGNEVVSLCTELGRQQQLSEAFNLIGAAHYTLGNYQQATDQFEHALSIVRELGDRSNVMALLNNLGWLNSALGNFEQAFAYYQQALAMARNMGNRNAEMVYLSNLGGTRVGMGDYAEAITDLLQVISVAEVTGLAELSETYRFLAEAYLGQGCPEEGLPAALQSLKLGQEIGAQEYIAGAYRVLGMVAAQLPDPVTVPASVDRGAATCSAEDCFTESVRICKEIGMQGELAQTLRSWAAFEFQRGEQEKGAAMWQEARELFSQLGAELEVERMARHPEQPV